MGGKWLAIPVTAAALGVAIGALTVHRRPAAAAGQNLPAAASVAHPEIILNGKIRPQHIVRVTPAASGPVVALPVVAGQEVYQGEVLARVGEAGTESVRDAALQAVEHAEDDVSKAEAQVIAARLETARAANSAQAAQIAVERAQRVYDRQKALHDAGATPRLVYEKAESDYQSAQQESTAAEGAVRTAANAVEAADAGLENARNVLAARKTESETAQLAFAAAEVRSPIDGILVASHAELGKSLEADAMFEIAADLEALEVAVEAQANVLQRIRPGQAAMVEIAEAGVAGVEGQVREIKDNTAIVEFNCTLAGVRPGMPVEVRLKLE